MEVMEDNINEDSDIINILKVKEIINSDNEENYDSSIAIDENNYECKVESKDIEEDNSKFKSKENYNNDEENIVNKKKVLIYYLKDLF